MSSSRRTTLNSNSQAAFSNKWSWTISSPTLTLKTWVDPQWSINEAIEHFKKKFSEEASDFVLYFETVKSFYLLDGDSVINSLEGLAHECEVVFREKGFKGSNKKPVVPLHGKKKEKDDSSRRSSSVSLSNFTPPSGSPVNSSSQSVGSPSNPSPISAAANQAPTKTSTEPTIAPKNPGTPDSKPQPTEPKPPQLHRDSSTMRKMTRTRSQQEKNQLDQFFEVLVKSCTSILTDVKNLREIVVKQECGEDDIFTIAQQTAQRTVGKHYHVISYCAELLTCVNRFGAKSKDPQFPFVVDKSKDVRTKVLDFIQSARNCISNPFDYLSKQRFDTSSKQLADSVKALLNAADTLQSDDEVVIKDEADEIFAERVKKVMEGLKKAIEALVSSLEKEDKDNFLASAKAIVPLINDVIQIDQEFQLSLQIEIKASTQSFLTCARSVLTIRDPSVQNQFAESRKQLQATLRKFVEALSSKSIEVKKQLTSDDAFNFKVKKEKKVHTDPQTEKDYRIKRNAAMKITNLLCSRFEMFHKQWVNQNPDDADEMWDLIVDEMTNSYLMYVQPNAAASVTVEEFNNAMQGKKSEKAKPEVETNEEDEEAMRELLKIMKMKDASDWQLTALNINIRRIAKKKNKDDEDSQISKIDETMIPTELENATKQLNETGVEFLFTVGEIIQLKEGFDEEKYNTQLTQAVNSFYKTIKKISLLSHLWLRPPRKVTAKPTQTAPTKFVTLSVEIVSGDGKLSYMKKIKLDAQSTTEDALKEIIDRLPESGYSVADYGLWHASQKLWVKKDKTLSEYPNIEKTNLQLKEIDSSQTAQKRNLGMLLDSITQAAECMYHEDSSNILASPTKGLVIDTIISALNEHIKGELFGSFTAKKLSLEEALQDRILKMSNAIRVLCMQIMSSLKALAGSSVDRREYNHLLQLISTCKQLLPCCVTLLNSVETYHYMETNCHEPEETKNTTSDVATDTFFIWNIERMKEVRDDTNSFKGGNINHIILELTQEDRLNNEFLSTFMITYQSFMTPFTVLQKLIQRYKVPEKIAKQDKDKCTKIQWRIAVVLKHWIENHFDDFDKRTIETLKNFINDTLVKDGQEKMVAVLTKEFTRKIDEQKAKKEVKTIELADFKIQADGRSPADLFLDLNESEIARQLTSIDFGIFVKIKTRELLNQSWSRDKLQHQAPNILAMISRANKISFWVASLILWFNKVKDRKRILAKIISIGQHLWQLHNFNTLMGFVAGMSISAIARLHHTWNSLEPETRQTFQTLQALFDPQLSFKRYRQELIASTPPVLPYLGTYLSDLTFTEDGNKDYLEENPEFINWTKRELVAKTVAEIKLHQQVPYNFPVVEPIHTFLTELPFLEDKELYDLSLLREPKGVDLKDLE